MFLLLRLYRFNICIRTCVYSVPSDDHLSIIITLVLYSGVLFPFLRN